MKTLLNNFIDLEERLIVKAIQQKFPNINDLRPVSENELHEINANLLLTNEENIAFQVHKDFIECLVTIFIKNNFSADYKIFKNLFNINDKYQNDILTIKDYKQIPELIEELHIAFLNSQFSITTNNFKRIKSKHYLKEFGAVYTLKSTTNEIVSNTIKNALTIDSNPKNIRCLDFASGTGRFYFEALRILENEYNLDLKDIVCKNLFALDLDEVALTILKCKVTSLFQTVDLKLINTLSQNILYRNALTPNNTLLEEFENSINFSVDFKEIFDNGGFDVVFSNPPYYLLKVNKKNSSLLNGYFANLQSKVKNEIKFFKTSGVYNYAIEGMLNYYQLSIEMILKMTKPNGQIGIICPSSIFADLTTTKLRKHLLTSNKIRFIRYYPEASNLFDNVAQSTVIFYLEKGGETNDIHIEFEKNDFYINYSTIKNVFPKNQEIPFIDKTGWKVLSKISKQLKLKEFDYLRNKRGELDLTQYKDCISKTDTSNFRLVRGNMITKNGLIDKNQEFVNIDAFINRKSEDYRTNDFQKERLICQQISNVDLKIRMKFTFSEKNDILANSCNYINSSRSFLDLKKLSFLLNSKLLNWRFKITSSNNHINNYELDDLPIIDLDKIDINLFSENSTKNEYLICELYGLNNEETAYVLGTPIKNIKKELVANEVI